jgi:hypothetical protein
MAPIAIAFGVLELTGSTADASIVIAAPTLASIAVLLVGGILVATVGAGYNLDIDALTFGLSASLIASLKPRGLWQKPLFCRICASGGASSPRTHGCGSSWLSLP